MIDKCYVRIISPYVRGEDIYAGHSLIGNRTDKRTSQVTRTQFETLIRFIFLPVSYNCITTGNHGKVWKLTFRTAMNIYF